MRRYAQRPPLSVFIQIDDEPIYTVNGRHVISEIVVLCGGRNVFADLPQLAPPISAEAVLAADPQVILSTDDTIANPLELWNRWPRMRAVRSGNVFKLSSDLVTRASPRLAQGVEVTCSALERARSRLSAPPQSQSQNAASASLPPCLRCRSGFRGVSGDTPQIRPCRLARAVHGARQSPETPRNRSGRAVASRG